MKKFYALIIRGEEQEARPLSAATEPEAAREAEALAKGLSGECTVALFAGKKPAPLSAWRRRADGSLQSGTPREID